MIRLLGVWSRQDVIAVIARPLIGAGLSCGAMASWMIYDSKIGKIRERETYLNRINWNGNERVLDVGCGLGLFLIGAAKRLSTGRAVGIDKWQQEDLSGNSAAGTLSNAMIEGVADKVEVVAENALSSLDDAIGCGIGCQDYNYPPAAPKRDLRLSIRPAAAARSRHVCW